MLFRLDNKENNDLMTVMIGFSQTSIDSSLEYILEYRHKLDKSGMSRNLMH